MISHDKPKYAFVDVVTPELFFKVLETNFLTLVNEDITSIPSLCGSLGIQFDLVEEGDSDENKKVVLFTAIFRGLLKAMILKRDLIFPQCIDIAEAYLAYSILADEAADNPRRMAQIRLMEISNDIKSSQLDGDIASSYHEFQRLQGVLLDTLSQNSGLTSISREVRALGLSDDVWKDMSFHLLTHGVMALWLDSVSLFDELMSLKNVKKTKTPEVKDRTNGPNRSNKDGDLECSIDALGPDSDVEEDLEDISRYHFSPLSQKTKRILH